MKGLILAGGTGSRLWPLTVATSKQLIPVYDKPTIYYPLTTLINQGITSVAIISTQRDVLAMKNLLGSGSDFGIEIEYLVQDSPNGIAEAFLIAESFIDENPVTLILGDNIFSGINTESQELFDGAQIFLYEVSNPRDYGNAAIDASGKVTLLIEKPEIPLSPFAVTGMYRFDGRVSKFAATLKPSKRGELEIIDLLEIYLKADQLRAHKLPRGSVWLDTGTVEGLSSASEFVRVVQLRQGTMIGSPHLAAFNLGHVSDLEMQSFLKARNSEYAALLREQISRSRNLI